MIDEKKLIEERPEWLNTDCVGNEEYNKGWNACNKYWCNTIKRQPKVGEWIPADEPPKDDNYILLSDENDVIVGKWCPKINDSPDVEAKRECVHYKRMTQADRIRAMSDEELAEWIHNITQYYDEEQEPTVSIYDLDTKKDTELHDSYGDLLKWLQSEVEE